MTATDQPDAPAIDPSTNYRIGKAAKLLNLERKSVVWLLDTGALTATEYRLRRTERRVTGQSMIDWLKSKRIDTDNNG